MGRPGVCPASQAAQLCSKSRRVRGMARSGLASPGVGSLSRRRERECPPVKMCSVAEVRCRRCPLAHLRERVLRDAAAVVWWRGVAPGGVSRVSARRPSSLSCLPRKGNPKKGTPTMAPRCAGCPAVLAAGSMRGDSGPRTLTPALSLGGRGSETPSEHVRPRRGSLRELHARQLAGEGASRGSQSGPYRSARHASPVGYGVEVARGLAPSPLPFLAPGVSAARLAAASGRRSDRGIRRSPRPTGWFRSGRRRPP